RFGNLALPGALTQDLSRDLQRERFARLHDVRDVSPGLSARFDVCRLPVRVARARKHGHAADHGDGTHYLRCQVDRHGTPPSGVTSRGHNDTRIRARSGTFALNKQPDSFTESAGARPHLNRPRLSPATSADVSGPGRWLREEPTDGVHHMAESITSSKRVTRRREQPSIRYPYAFGAAMGCQRSNTYLPDLSR